MAKYLKQEPNYRIRNIVYEFITSKNKNNPIIHTYIYKKPRLNKCINCKNARGYK